jgi:hypothetical protein
VGGIENLTVEGAKAVRGLSSGGREIADEDAIVLAGALVPNSELLVESGLAVTPPHHAPVAQGDGSLSTAGVFAAGNVLGGFHGADWCHRHGRRVGRGVARWLERAMSDER